VSKSDAPALRMIVETGPRLAPASAFDAERLDTFKIGRVMRFRPVDEADRKDVRQWWACINRALKVSKTPWSNAQQASEAIKLALGIVNLGKTVSGQWMQFPKSLNDLDDAELADAVRDMKDLLHKITGVDPDDWHRETADVGEDDNEIASPAGETIQSAQDEAMEPASTTSQPEVDAGSHQSVAADQEGGAETDDAPSSELIAKMHEALTKFIGVVTDKAVPDKKDRQDILVMMKNNWKDALPTRPDFVKACTTQMNKVLKGEISVEDAREYLEGLIR